MGSKSEKKIVEKYLAEHELEKVINEVLNICLREKPQDPFALLGKLLRERSGAGKGITNITARIVFDESGGECFEVEVQTDNGKYLSQVGVAEVKSKFKRVGGNDFLDAVNGPIRKAIIGKDPSDLEAIDQLLLTVDDTDDKSEVGVNTISAVSMAVCRAGSATRSVSLHQHIGGIASKKEFAIPVPWVSALEVGDSEEIGLVPIGSESLSSAVTSVNLVLDHIKRKKDWEGKTLAECVDMVLEIITTLELQNDIKLAISVRESDLVKPEKESAENEETVPVEVPEPAVEPPKPDPKAKDAKKPAKGKGAEPEPPKPVEPEATEPVKIGSSGHDRESTRGVVLDLLADETKASNIVIVENIFRPGQWKAMESFVEEYGDLVVLFNGYDAANKEVEPEHLEDPTEEQKDERPPEDTEEEDGSRPSSASSKKSNESVEGLPPCNGDKIYVGTPFGEVATVTDLIGLCEMKQTQGQSVAVVWEEEHSSLDSFGAEFSIGMSTGLVKVGKLHTASSMIRVNQLIRLEQELAETAFYAGSRFRSPF